MSDLATARIRRATLHELVAVTGPLERSCETVKMPRPELVQLLRAAGELVDPAPAVDAVIAVRRRSELIVAFIAATFCGVLLTVPLWW